MDSEALPERVTLRDLVPMNDSVAIAVCDEKGKVMHEGRITELFVRPGETVVRVCCHRGLERTMSARYMGLITVPGGELSDEFMTFRYSPLYSERDYQRAFANTQNLALV